jgi:hypothetical protein
MFVCMFLFQMPGLNLTGSTPRVSVSHSINEVRKECAGEEGFTSIWKWQRRGREGGCKYVRTGFQTNHP